MPSVLAKKVAGTFILDEQVPAAPLLAWLRQQARHGALAEHVRQFCARQSEALDPALVQIESVDAEGLHCRIPCRLYDHESVSPFPSEVRFSLNPATGLAVRR